MACDTHAPQRQDGGTTGGHARELQALTEVEVGQHVGQLGYLGGGELNLVDAPAHRPRVPVRLGYG